MKKALECILVGVALLALIIGLSGGFSSDSNGIIHAMNPGGPSFSINPSTQTIDHDGTIYTYTIEKSLLRSVCRITYPHGAVYTAVRTLGGTDSAWEGAYDPRYLEPHWILAPLENAMTTWTLLFRPPLPAGIPIALAAVGLLMALLPELFILLDFHRSRWLFQDEPNLNHAPNIRLIGIIVTVVGAILLIIRR